AEEPEFDEAHARAAERFGDGDAEQARLRERVPRLPIVPFARRLETLQAIVGRMVAEDLPCEIAERFLVLTTIEIHVSIGSGCALAHPHSAPVRAGAARPCSDGRSGAFGACAIFLLVVIGPAACRGRPWR